MKTIEHVDTNCKDISGVWSSVYAFTSQYLRWYNPWALTKQTAKFQGVSYKTNIFIHSSIYFRIYLFIAHCFRSFIFIGYQTGYPNTDNWYAHLSLIGAVELSANT
jgi:hypothetical protein